jgi:carboxyl-terminal processing protease
MLVLWPVHGIFLVHRPIRLSNLVAALLTVLFVVSVTACSSLQQIASPQSGNRRVNPPPETQQAPTRVGTGPALLREGPMSSAELRLVFRAILERFVDRLDHGKLIRAGADGLRSALRQEGVLPMFTAPLDLLPSPSGNIDEDWVAFSSAYDAIVQKLPAWSKESHADWIVIRQMMESLDDGHSTFLTPDDMQRRSETTYVGIGVRLARSSQGQSPLVAEVFPNSPAGSAGLKSGDRIVEVDGQDLTGRAVADVVQVIRGPRDSEVTLRVRRQNSPELLEFRLRRAQVQIEPVTVVMSADGAVGNLRIRNFTDETVPDQALQVLLQARQRGARAWLLDLRGNPGGSLTAVTRVAGLFMENRPIGFQVRQGQQSPIVAEGSGPMTRGMPVAILVDEETASGGEILAAALREYDIARVVGANTAGNVGVAGQVSLPDGSAIQITEQRYVTPSGAKLDRVGVKPDVPVEMNDADIEAGRDPQLQKALAILTERLGVTSR